jgi:hypothetical protein
MKIIITKPQLKLIQESYDYNDLPLKTSTIHHHNASKVEYGGQDSYHNYKKYEPKSEDEIKINKVRTKLIGIYDTCFDKIRRLNIKIANNKHNPSKEYDDIIREKTRVENTVQDIKEILRNKESLLSMYDKFKNLPETEHTPIRDVYAPLSDYESVRNQTDNEEYKTNQKRISKEFNSSVKRYDELVEKRKREIYSLHDRREYYDNVLKRSWHSKGEYESAERMIKHYNDKIIEQIEKIKKYDEKFGKQSNLDYYYYLLEPKRR